MNNRIKTLWIEALRSGKYKQGFGCLQDADGGYCCFGVLEKLAVEEGAVPSLQPDRKYLSDTVVRWASLPEWHPQVPGPDGEKEPLAYLNDRGLDFNYIADRIEQYL